MRGVYGKYKGKPLNGKKNPCPSSLPAGCPPTRLDSTAGQCPLPQFTCVRNLGPSLTIDGRGGGRGVKVLGGPAKLS